MNELTFRPVAKSDNGVCERCGTLCPKETVMVSSCDGEGNPDGEVTMHWGVCCTAQYCYGGKSERNRKKVKAAIEQYELQQKWEEENRIFRIANGTTRTYTEYRYTTSGLRYNSEPITVNYGTVKGHANALYHITRHPLPGSFFMSHPDGRMVRTNGKPSDVAFYTNAGFVQATAPSVVQSGVIKNGSK